MFSNRGSSLISTVLAVAAAGGVGVAGYYLVSGGAGCGSCSTHAGTDVAAVTPVAAATDAKDYDCAAACSGDAMVVAADAKSDCAAACSGEAQVVAMEGESCAAACSGDAMTVANAGESCSIEKACDADAAACESSCDGKNEGEIMQVSNEAEKADCATSCDGEAKVCPVSGQPIADAGS
ncbi:MAG: hypothetical protein AAFO89_03760 [Planctomycetota bacterium]